MTTPTQGLGEGGEDLQLRPHTRETTKVQNLPTLPETADDRSERATGRRGRPHERHKKAGMTDRLIDIPQAAERLSVGERFVKRLVAEKRVPYYKVGPFVRFDPADLDAWLATRRVENW